MTVCNTNKMWGNNFFNGTSVVKRNGESVPFELQKFEHFILRCCENTGIDQSLLLQEIGKNLFDGMKTSDIEQASILAATSLIEVDTAYDIIAVRILLQHVYKDVIGKSIDSVLSPSLKECFINGIKIALNNGQLDPRMANFDLEYLAKHLRFERDFDFNYLGLQTVTNRYVLRDNNRRLETPQAFWMRVAMGLSLSEDKPNERAVQFYEIMSTLRFVPSTPTLLHSGLKRAQLSSCFLTTISDDLEHIFKCLKDNAMMSKWSGGVANDWTNIRGTGSNIDSIKVESQGLIPFIKIANDVTVAINRSGKRRGATVAYLEMWHYDFEDFIDLRRNTGDERRRAHDMNFAAWVPDLFMKRLINDELWTLFSPDEVPDLHDLYGADFEKKYVYYEQKAREGSLKLWRTIQAKELWRKVITRLFETGFPWITFKDPCNVRSPQDHVGVVHSSNLCTEITLNTSADETAVCNLGSVNLAKHFKDKVFERELFSKTINTAMRMLDNVIDLNFYPTVEGKNANMRHRPVGLGMMGFQDALFLQELNIESQEALEFANNVTELYSFNAIKSSIELAIERGAYSSFNGSKWERGLLPLDTIDLLEKERGLTIEQDRKSSLPWHELRSLIKKHGMRNSNTMAIAPTATISNMAGCSPCIEPIYSNLFVESNMLGEFTLVNKYLVSDLKKLNLWNKEMLDMIKYYDGSIQQIPMIPESIKKKYKTSFEIDPFWLIELESVRAKWVDQSISHNIFVKGATGKLLSDIYCAAWKKGLKTTYYLRTMAATQIEKSTLDSSYGFTQKRVYTEMSKACSLENPDCESCQ